MSFSMNFYSYGNNYGMNITTWKAVNICDKI